jgi:hypothetical protein
MFVKPKMHASTSHVSGSKYIINPSSTSCKTDWGNFIDLAYKDKSIRGGLSYTKWHWSKSIPFHFIDWGGAMKAANVFAILIVTTEVACVTSSLYHS